MAERRSRKLFVNLSVRDLKKSMTFSSSLGFAFDTTKHTEVFWMDPAKVGA